jgi:hypothetical protein
MIHHEKRRAPRLWLAAVVVQVVVTALTFELGGGWIAVPLLGGALMAVLVLWSMRDTGDAGDER